MCILSEDVCCKFFSILPYVLFWNWKEDELRERDSMTQTNTIHTLDKDRRCRSVGLLFLILHSYSYPWGQDQGRSKSAKDRTIYIPSTPFILHYSSLCSSECLPPLLTCDMRDSLVIWLVWEVEPLFLLIPSPIPTIPWSLNLTHSPQTHLSLWMCIV